MGNSPVTVATAASGSDTAVLVPLCPLPHPSCQRPGPRGASHRTLQASRAPQAPGRQPAAPQCPHFCKALTEGSQVLQRLWTDCGRRCLLRSPRAGLLHTGATLTSLWALTPIPPPPRTGGAGAHRALVSTCTGSSSPGRLGRLPRWPPGSVRRLKPTGPRGLEAEASYGHGPSQDTRGGARQVQIDPTGLKEYPPPPSTVCRLQEHLPEDGSAQRGPSYFAKCHRAGLCPVGSPK